MSAINTPRTLHKTLKSIIFQFFAPESDIFSLGTTFLLKTRYFFYIHSSQTVFVTIFYQGGLLQPP